MALDDKLDPNDIPQHKLDLQSGEILTWCNDTLTNMGLAGDNLIYTRTIVLSIVLIGLGYAIWWLSRKIFLQIVHTLAEKTKSTWDDHLVTQKFFKVLAHLVPLLFMDFFISIVFHSFPRISDFLIRLTDFVIIFVLIIILLRFMNATRDVLAEKPALKDKPLHSFFQLGKIVISIVLGVVMISVAFKVDLVVILTSMGAMTAVILLVFKDTIMGFVGSIQLASNDMVRIGDWVTMEKYGADGDVLEITLNTVKVQNFDMTITTIPTYAFISDSFRNWRGMQESGGRRIVRSINIQLSSVKFCTPDLLNKLGEIELIRSYVVEKENEIEDFNKNNKVNRSVLINGRNQTNIGIFRHYITEYLSSHEDINPDMTLMVRQLEPTETGVSLQVYCFTKTHDWQEYEMVISNIFDHLMSTVEYFDLAIFENPSGKDFNKLVN